MIWFVYASKFSNILVNISVKSVKLDMFITYGCSYIHNIYVMFILVHMSTFTLLSKIIRKAIVYIANKVLGQNKVNVNVMK